MAKPKRKLTGAEKAARRRFRREHMMIFVNGKQKRVRREPTIDGLPVEEFLRRNADPVWLAQNEMWEYQDAANERASPLPRAAAHAGARIAARPDSEAPEGDPDWLPEPPGWMEEEDAEGAYSARPSTSAA